jgi:hypothetical protein
MLPLVVVHEPVEQCKQIVTAGEEGSDDNGVADLNRAVYKVQLRINSQ